MPCRLIGMDFVLFTFSALCCMATVDDRCHLLSRRCYAVPSVDCAGHFHVVISSPIYNCRDRRLMFAGNHVYSLSTTRRREAVLTALLLLLGGVEQNPGPSTAGSTGVARPASALRLGVLNVRSAVRKAALVHDIIDSQRVDILVLTETWMSSDQPPAVTQDVAPPGFSVIHRFRDSGAGGGVAVVHRRELSIMPVVLTTAVQSLESLMLKLTTQRCRQGRSQDFISTEAKG